MLTQWGDTSHYVDIYGQRGFGPVSGKAGEDRRRGGSSLALVWGHGGQTGALPISTCSMWAVLNVGLDLRREKDTQRGLDW